MRLGKITLSVAVCLSLPAALFADFSLQRTTSITGGSMAGMMKMASAFSKKAGQPTVSNEFVKGNRMATWSPDRGSITDLDKETITTINVDKKTYSVMTFEQMREMVQQAASKMSGKSNDGTELKFRVSSNETGRTQNISGHNAKEVVVTVEADANSPQHGSGSMNITSAVWLAKDVAGYDEVKAFHKRMAEKLGYLPDQQMAQMRQAMSGMVEVSKKMASMEGVPVRTVTKMGDLMESTSEMSGFSSTAVEDAKFEVPAGFKQVEAPMSRRAH